jgi:hypothetical protein
MPAYNNLQAIGYNQCGANICILIKYQIYHEDLIKTVFFQWTQV